MPPMTQAPDAAGELLAAIAAERIVPVLTVDDAARARPLGDALKAGGLHCAEVTFRTDAAEAALRALAEDPELLVGAGTVLTTDQVERAARAGARYVVSPGLDVDVIRRCRQLGLAVLPGVATATELQAALREGVDVVKLFPAEPLGGVPMLRALSAAFPTVRFVPTGGITLDKLPAYLAEPAVVAAGASFIAPPQLLAAGDFAEITRRAGQAAALVRGR
jgi:2-dehydro-3-deoxyphosphogluconate aldolase/(4S)-4-hydroxy-2-oxoglutarate aldolase